MELCISCISNILLSSFSPYHSKTVLFCRHFHTLQSSSPPSLVASIGHGPSFCSNSLQMCRVFDCYGTVHPYLTSLLYTFSHFTFLTSIFVFAPQNTVICYTAIQMDKSVLSLDSVKCIYLGGYPGSVKIGANQKEGGNDNKIIRLAPPSYPSSEAQRAPTAPKCRRQLTLLPPQRASSTSCVSAGSPPRSRRPATHRSVASAGCQLVGSRSQRRARHQPAIQRADSPCPALPHHPRLQSLALLSS